MNTLYVGLLSTATLLAQAASSTPSSCTFHQVAARFVGSCGPLFDQTPEMTLGRATALSSGIWREDVKPTSMWSGTMTDDGYPNDPLELKLMPAVEVF